MLDVVINLGADLDRQPAELDQGVNADADRLALLVGFPVIAPVGCLSDVGLVRHRIDNDRLKVGQVDVGPVDPHPAGGGVDREFVIAGKRPPVLADETEGPFFRLVDGKQQRAGGPLARAE